MLQDIFRPTLSTEAYNISQVQNLNLSYLLGGIHLSSKKWFFSFLSMILLVAVLVALLNFTIDPFGVFGDHFFDWYSFNFTNNPRVAKIAYLDKHYKEYDSYIIGSSTTSAYSVEKLNAYTGNKFYNLFMYGCDLYDVAKTVSYVIDNYEVKNIIMPIGLREAVKYDFEDDILTDNLHIKVDGDSEFYFYLKYLFANPKYSTNKIHDYLNDSYLPQKFDVFLERTGVYDKTERDVEPISDMEQYFVNYPAFNSYDYHPNQMEYFFECLACISEIKAKCDEKGINFTLIFSPEYYLQKNYYNIEELKNFWVALSAITDFWDFSFSSVSTDARYFYDVTHIRNVLGDMILARIYNNDIIYRPADLGYYVTPENAWERVQFFDNEIEVIYDNSAEIPVIKYSSINTELFEWQIRGLWEAGYQTATVSDLVNYVNLGGALPEKPIVITIDNFNRSNINYVYDVLKGYGFSAVVFVNNLDKNLIATIGGLAPVLNAEICSAGFLSDRTDYNRDEEISYINTFIRDINNTNTVFFDNVGIMPVAFSYKENEYCILNDALLKNAGIKVTFSSDEGKINTIIRGLPQSLLTLNRIKLDENSSTEEIVNIIKKGGAE